MYGPNDTDGHGDSDVGYMSDPINTDGHDDSDDSDVGDMSDPINTNEPYCSSKD